MIGTLRCMHLPSLFKGLLDREMNQTRVGVGKEPTKLLFAQECGTGEINSPLMKI